MMPDINIERDPVLANTETSFLEDQYSDHIWQMNERFEEWVNHANQSDDDDNYFDNQRDLLVRLIRASQVQLSYTLELMKREPDEVGKDD
jgi:hypothetical protein